VKLWRLATAITYLAAAFQLHGDSAAITKSRLIKPLPGPPLILWAWEEPEDLRALDPSHAGVAFLAERIFLGSSPQFIPRHQPIAVPANIDATAVVRIETRPGFRDTETLRALTARELLRVASLPHTYALQVDFDATQSQQPFYADVLRRTRASLPPDHQLTITALISWCAIPSGWLATLPIDAAVPMYFRLGKHTGTWLTREPLCSTTRGISTDEPLRASPKSVAQTYIFTPHSWTPSQITQINQDKIPTDTLVARGNP
jgi:hypothetical protein